MFLRWQICCIEPNVLEGIGYDSDQGGQVDVIYMDLSKTYDIPLTIQQA